VRSSSIGGPSTPSAGTEPQRLHEPVIAAQERRRIETAVLWSGSRRRRAKQSVPGSARR